MNIKQVIKQKLEELKDLTIPVLNFDLYFVLLITRLHRFSRNPSKYLENCFCIAYLHIFENMKIRNTNLKLFIHIYIHLYSNAKDLAAEECGFSEEHPHYLK